MKSTIFPLDREIFARYRRDGGNFLRGNRQRNSPPEYPAEHQCNIPLLKADGESDVCRIREFQINLDTGKKQTYQPRGGMRSSTELNFESKCYSDTSLGCAALAWTSFVSLAIASVSSYQNNYLKIELALFLAGKCPSARHRLPLKKFPDECCFHMFIPKPFLNVM
jgi:hypothetical protein